MLGESSIVTYWRGMTSGDPAAWGITIVVIAIFGAALYWDNRRRSNTKGPNDP